MKKKNKLPQTDKQIEHNFSENTNRFPHRTRQSASWKQKRARPPKVILCSNNTVDGTTIPEYKQYNKAVVMRHHGTGTKTDTGISGTEPRALSAI